LTLSLALALSLSLALAFNNNKTKLQKLQKLQKQHNYNMKTLKARDKRIYQDFDLELIFNTIYIPTISGSGDIKTSKNNASKFLRVLRLMGEVSRKYNKEVGTHYSIVPSEDTIELSRWEVGNLLSLYPISEENLVNLYIRLLESGVDPNVLETIIDYKNYIQDTLEIKVNRFGAYLLDYKLIIEKPFK
jgi:hypothetical protein